MLFAVFTINRQITIAAIESRIGKPYNAPRIPIKLMGLPA